MNRKSMYWGFLFSMVLGSLVFILGLDRKNYSDFPVTVYQVYLNGNPVGVINDEEELYNLIDKEQENLKSDYDVNKIYAPIGLETTKLVTYEGKVDEVIDVYNKIKDVEPFTVKGYEVTIARNEESIETVNILKKEDFDIAVDNTIKAFVDEEQYKNYLEKKQAEIVTTGSKIEDISLRENITIKEKYISTEDVIYTDANDLSRYMLFGTNETQGTHIVKAGETINKIANDYELNVKEFLIVNPEIMSENALLFPGQEVNVGLVNPIVSVVVENTLVEDKVVEYKQEEKYDPKINITMSYVEQQGQNGLNRETYYTETINGVMTQVVPRHSEVLTPVVNEVLVRGGLPSQNIGDTGDWAWPTNRPYVITSYFGWRTDPVYGGHAFHAGIDISGTGHGSPIYAAQTGVITRLGYDRSMGNYIYIDHRNGTQTVYMHMSNFVAGMRVGSEVTKGEQIGYMGTTGKSTGTHLDFRIINNGVYVDPLSVTYNQ